MAIQDDFSVATNGDIRYVGSGATYTVIQLHRWLGDLMDDAQAAGNDLLDITDATASERATDNLITLNSPYNIDDIAARYLYDGSIVQGVAGATIYDGIVCYAPAGTYLQVQQNGAILSPNFWTTAYNADAAQGISHRFMVKVRSGGSDIDGRRLIGQTREVGKTYSEFRINGTSRGNNVFALTFADDLNNATAEATIRGWTSISNTEGYRLLDVDNIGGTEPYYSEWNRASQTINQLYERTKWLSRRATVESSCTDVGTDFQLGNATITGQAQSFANGANAQFLTRAFFQLKKTGSPTGNLTVKLYAHSGSLGTTSVPTGAALATSTVVASANLTTSYQTVEFTFPTPYEMAASTNYVLSIEKAVGDGSNYVQVRGLATTGTHAGNRSEEVGTWSATATDDLNFSIHASPKLYGEPGELFRGITHELSMTTPRSGTFSTVERVTWPSGGSGIMVAVDVPATSTKMWIQVLTGTAPSTGTLITGVTSGATGTTTGAPTERTLSAPFFGASTGSAMIGAYGIGVETTDLTASDKLFDLTNTQRIPPNNVTFTVNGLVIGEDRVLVGPESGGTLNLAQFALNTTLSGATETAVVLTASIPTDTPATGTIRIELDSGIYRRVAYTSYTGSTFTIGSTDFSGANQATAGADVFISYIDKLATATSESFTGVYLANRSLFVRVRDGGGSPIKTFETTGTLSSAGGSATAIRTSDA
jgi:hypothetical protein